MGELTRNWELTLFTTAILLVMFAAACASSPPASVTTISALPTVAATTIPVPPTPIPLSYVNIDSANGRTSLRCEECRAVEVVDVTGPETIITSEGPVRLYGVFVAPEEENCVEEATDRLMMLVSGTVRLEEDLLETDSAGTPIRYVYTDSGDSIDELFISEGLARASAFDGSHAPWLLVTADNARRDRNGCIWDNFDRIFPQRTPRASGGLS